MAVVFLARDRRLGRKVAVKVLRPELSSSVGADRFFGEIRIAAALNHPHIVPVFDSGKADGLLYYVMPWVEGETLRARIAEHGRLPVAEAARQLSEIADALAHAHRHGVVHRDIKPDNVLLADSHAHVMDFGLARALHGAMQEKRLTSTGISLGTPAYMAPEQASGAETIDGRADIYALGVTAYEMLGGAAPFAGVSAHEVLMAHVNRSPLPLDELRSNLPRPLVDLVMRCLEKDPADRFQRAEELLPVLASVASSSSGLAPVQGTSPHRWWPVLAIAGVVLAALVTMLIFEPWAEPRNARAPDSSRSAAMTRLTSTGQVARAAISPDGRVVALLSSRDNSIRVHQVATDGEIELLPPDEDRYSALAIGPNGDYVYFVRRQMSYGRLWRVPLLGGEPQEAIADIDSDFSFSPDGSRVAFLRIVPADTECALVIANTDGSRDDVVAKAHLLQDNFGLAAGVAWAPDGREVAVMRGGNSGLAVAGMFGLGEPSRIVCVDAATGASRKLTDPIWGAVNGLEYLPDGTLLVSGARQERPTSQLWRVSPDGTVERISSDLNDYVGVSVARSTGAIVTVLSDASSTISILSDSTNDQLEPVTSGAGRYDGQLGLTWTRDGRIVYTSATTGGVGDLWICDADGSNTRRLTDDDALESLPRVSPDDSFVVYKAGIDRGLARLDLDSRRSTVLTTDPFDSTPSILTTGEVLFSRRGDVHLLDAEAGESTVTARLRFGGGVPSPDGRHLLGPDVFEGRIGVGLIPADGAPPTARYGALWKFPLAMTWTADSETVTYLSMEGTRQILSNLNLADGTTEPLLELASDRVLAFAWSADGRLAVAHGPRNSDAVMLEGID